MTLREVKDRKTLKDFHKLPFRIYKNDPNWIPHLKQDVEKIFDKKKNKKWRKGEAIRWVLYDNKNVPIGRIAAFVDNGNHEHTAGVGFFECEDNKEAAFFLLDSARDWLIGKGANRMDGPINFGENHQFWGLIIENFDEPPYYGQNYNHQYYVSFFEEYGFEIYFKQLIYYRDLITPLPDTFAERAKRLDNDPNYSTSCIDPKNFEKYAEDFRTIYNRAWAKREKGFQTMSKAQARFLLESLKPIMDPELTYFVYYKEQPIGMYVQLPEINQIFRHVNGNLNLFGKLKFLYHKKRGTVKRAFGMVFGIDPDYQGKGVEGLIFKEMERLIYDTRKYDDLVITWIGDFNPKMIAIVETLGTRKMRTMATYRYLFDRNAPFKRKPIVTARSVEENN